MTLILCLINVLNTLLILIKHLIFEAAHEVNAVLIIPFSEKETKSERGK